MTASEYDKKFKDLKSKLKYLQDEYRESDMDFLLITRELKSLQKDMEEIGNMLDVEDFLINGPGQEDPI
jgi:septation ring formation regulator EzrA